MRSTGNGVAEPLCPHARKSSFMLIYSPAGKVKDPCSMKDFRPM
jgi:hypothetical protein